jgi:ABC-type Fe3+-hydroxamate transport system substrate-binding protein
MNNAKKIFVASLLFATFLTGCSSQPETANNNTASSAPVAQSGTVPATSETAAPSVVTPSPQPAVPAAEPPKIAAGEEVPKVAVGAPAAPSGPSPKLVVPSQKIDFGKQPQSTSLARTITIRNGGKAPLNIAAVEPS